MSPISTVSFLWCIVYIYMPRYLYNLCSWHDFKDMRCAESFIINEDKKQSKFNLMPKVNRGEKDIASNIHKLVSVSFSYFKHKTIFSMLKLLFYPIFYHSTLHGEIKRKSFAVLRCCYGVNV